MKSYLLFWKKILIDCSEVALSSFALSSFIYMYHEKEIRNKEEQIGSGLVFLYHGIIRSKQVVIFWCFFVFCFSFFFFFLVIFCCRKIFN